MADDNAHIAGPGRPARPAGSTVIEVAGLDQGAGRTTFDGRPNRELAEPARRSGR